jgi:hypothetical protein
MAMRRVGVRLLPRGIAALVLGGVLAASCTAPAATTSSPTTSPILTVAPTTAPQTATPTATPSPTAVPRPGLITRNGSGPIVVRTEADVTPVRTVPSFGFTSNGSRLTYWTESAGAAELHILEVGGNDRIVATFPARRPGGAAWSTDGTGLLVSVDDSGDPRFLIPRVLMAVDIASGGSREVYRGIGPSGASVVPLVWRRAPEIFAAYETGPGGFSFGYTVIRPGQPPVRTEPDGRVVGMAASIDGALVSGTWLDEGPGTIKVWPVDDFSKKTALTLAADERSAQQYWWPEGHEIAFAVGRYIDGSWRDRRIERWDPATDARAVLKRLADGVPQLGAFLVRADGTGVLTQGQAPAFAWEVTDLRTGVTMPIPQLQGENILRTVVIR